MSDKQLAKKHFGMLHDNWIYEEQRHYQEYHEVECADEIPTSKLKDHNYKDLRVIQEFFEENHYA